MVSQSVMQFFLFLHTYLEGGGPNPMLITLSEQFFIVSRMLVDCKKSCCDTNPVLCDSFENTKLIIILSEDNKKLGFLLIV